MNCNRRFVGGGALTGRAPGWSLGSNPSLRALVLAALGTGACVGRPGPIAPDELPPLARRAVVQWVRELRPRSPLRYDLRWIYETQQGRTRGRAAVRFAPPDSLRFDYRGPFGRAGAAVLVGDSVVWARPSDDVEELIPVVRLFWGAMGIPQDPPVGAAVWGREASDVRVWRHATTLDTLTYVERWGSGHTLTVEMRHAGSLVGTATAEYAAGAVLRGARMHFPASAALFTVSVQDVEQLTSVDPSVWREP